MGAERAFFRAVADICGHGYVHVTVLVLGREFRCAWRALQGGSRGMHRVAVVSAGNTHVCAPANLNQHPSLLVHESELDCELDVLLIDNGIVVALLFCTLRTQVKLITGQRSRTSQSITRKHLTSLRHAGVPIPSRSRRSVDDGARREAAVLSTLLRSRWIHTPDQKSRATSSRC